MIPLNHVGDAGSSRPCGAAVRLSEGRRRSRARARDAAVRVDREMPYTVRNAGAGIDVRYQELPRTGVSLATGWRSRRRRRV